MKKIKKIGLVISGVTASAITVGFAVPLVTT